MNRIQMLDQDLNTNSLSTNRTSTTGSNSKQAVEHSFFVPLHYEPNYAYPLVVWLHGPSDGHRQLKQVMPHISMRNYVGVAPGWPPAKAAEQGESEFASVWSQDAHGIVETMSRVHECVQLAKNRFNIAPKRVFLAGFDCGGTMAIRLGLAAPNRFAGVASLGGPVPTGNNPLSNLLQARSLPMLIGYGRESEQYPVSQICEELRLFHIAGLSLNLRQYPCGHELTTQMLSDLDAWMMQIVTGVDSCSESAPEYLRFEEN
ncbi:MAG: alpha/beta hydrolase-fold protein [Pirellulaceae bacterium]|nr:alpha/beta hydrolase-fold protein [Pirellulaceae bacterium]